MRAREIVREREILNQIKKKIWKRFTPLEIFAQQAFNKILLKLYDKENK